MKNKRGQIKLSFGMIFSIILIIIFLAFSFYAIKKFLDVQNSVEVGKFGNDFQNDVDSIWKGTQGLKQEEYLLSESIKYICLGDLSKTTRGNFSSFYNDFEKTYYGTENLFFYPVGSAQGLDSKKINHIDISSTTKLENPFCVENKNGRVRLIIKKDFGEDLVTITR